MSFVHSPLKVFVRCAVLICMLKLLRLSLEERVITNFIVYVKNTLIRLS